MTFEHTPFGDRIVCDTTDCTASFARTPAHWLEPEELREQAGRHWWMSGLGLDWCPVHAARRARAVA